MNRWVSGLLLGGFLSARAALAQETVWVQIEAQPTLTEAQDRIRAYSARLPDVNGFDLGTGWYGIALGPYSPEDAEIVLRRYRAEGVIPRDSYIALPSAYERQFWPAGAELAQTAQAPEAPEATPLPEAAPEPAPAPTRDTAETRAEALQSERALSREEREALQVALRWAGYYDAAIDGAFGRGTRNSMALWQEANAYPATGVLTTAQRAELLRQYNAVLEGLDLRVATSAETGIALKLPLGAVAFDRLEPPFAHYTATGEIDARVLLISQSGDRADLAGLYEVMQTLDIVPLDGPRTLSRNGFTLEGRNAEMISYTEARLDDGAIKGFTLIWPAGDEERRSRLLTEMRDSFRRLPGVLPADAGATSEMRPDLLSGLQIRQPARSRSGFYIGDEGLVLTTADVVEGCGRITIDGDFEARLAAVDTELGAAVLRPAQAIAPPGTATFRQSTPRLRAEIAVAGYSYGGRLGAPTLTFGALADLRGLSGESGVNRLDLAALDGDAGGPVLDDGGAVMGMLLPRADGPRRLPDDVAFAADGAALTAMLGQAGISFATAGDLTRLSPEDLTAQATEMTVLVDCWE